MSSTSPQQHPKHIGLLLFPGFQLLDAAGPLDALHLLSLRTPLRLSVFARTLDPVGTQNPVQTAIGSAFSPAMVPTHTFASAPDDLDVLIVPGGLGSRGEGSEERMQGVVEFLTSLELDKKPEDRTGKGRQIRYVLTVCTGSEILARTHLLDGRRATTNKRVFNEVKAKHPQVEWIAKARWVVDGDVWTSSGVSAGMDLVFAWMSEVWGEEVAQETADRSEYVRNGDGAGDGFAERWGAV
ncbi:DJ-1/PfpI family protein-like protein [Phaeosphaeriaceae sp. SRC1lsM3a]|nr:DJ-1/PfpI family protein-like protein [Stagonospora sp. SRC1lsM3a]